MANAFVIPRDVLVRVLGDNRAVSAIERMGETLTATNAATTANVADTQTLKDAAFITLSANAELPNERTLQFGKGIAADITAGSITLRVDRNVPTVNGGFSVAFVAAGDSQLGLPPAGTLATQEWVGAQGYSSGGLVPSGSGAPGYTPTPPTGFLAMYYDTTGNQLYVYNGAWKKVALT